MSDLSTCPCCFGILDVPRHYTLTSACRCGFPEKVTWENFKTRDSVSPEARERAKGGTRTPVPPIRSAR